MNFFRRFRNLFRRRPSPAELAARRCAAETELAALQRSWEAAPVSAFEDAGWPPEEVTVVDRVRHSVGAVPTQEML